MAALILGLSNTGAGPALAKETSLVGNAYVHVASIELNNPSDPSIRITGPSLSGSVKMPLPKLDIAALPISWQPERAAPSPTYRTPGTGSALRKVGAPYQIDGIWFIPSRDETYDETGIASWYGEDFHGKTTANGEEFDMDAVTAAHPTLPMPGYVEVTNLDNGRKLVVRLNDRGPYVGNRVIDLSRGAAKKLGYYEKGTANVRVRWLGDAPLPQELGYVAPERVATMTPVRDTMPRLPPLVYSTPRATPTPVAAPELSGCNTSAVIDTGYAVQVGSFLDQANAQGLAGAMRTLGPTDVRACRVETRIYYRVIIGPVYDKADAERVLATVKGQGHSGARLVRP